MAPSHKSRELFRVSALVPSKALYRVSIALTEAKAMNVETVPVTSDEPKASRAQNGPTIKTKIIAAFQPGMIFDAASIAAIIDEQRHSIGVALAQMAKAGSIERVSQGKYRLAKRAAKSAAPAMTNGGGAAPKDGKRAGGLSDHVRALFEAAPEHKLTREQIKEAIVAHGGSARSFDGVVSRLKAKSVGGGVWQMRGSK